MTTKISSDNIQATTLATIGSGPKISQVQVCDSSYNVLDDTAVDLSGGYIKIVGSGFKTAATVTVNRQQAVSVTFISSTELLAQVPAELAGTYVVYVVNSDGGVALRVNGITFSALPNWTTDSTLPQGDSGSALSIQLSATDAAVYTLDVNSTLPPGVSLSSTGLLSGTVEVQSETVYNFVVVATDTELQDSPRSFSISITSGDPLFAYVTALLSPELEVLPFNADSSTNKFPLAIAGDTRPNSFGPYTPGYYSNYFDGSSDQLTVSSNAAFAFAGDFTVEAWIYPTVVTEGVNFIADFRSTTNSNFAVGLIFSGRLYIQTNTSLVSSAEVKVNLNTWNHVAYVRNGTTVTVYLNGISGGSVTTSYSQTSSPVTIGSAFNNTQPFTGYISNLRIVKDTAVYTSAFTPPTQPLTAVAGTSLLTCQSNRFIDNSVNNFAVTRNGDVRIERFDPFVPAAEFASRGSTYFDGSGDSLTVPPGIPTYLSSDLFTIEAWVYPRADNGLIVGRRAVPAARGFFLGYGTGEGANRFSFWAGDTDVNTWNLRLNSANTFPLNQWYHVAATRSSGNVFTLWVNGVSEATGTSNFAIADDTITLQIGTLDTASSPLNGYISNLRLVKDTAVYTAAFTPPTEPLTAVAGTSLLTCQTNQPVNNNTFLDSSSNNLLVTRSGNATQGTFSPYGGGWSNYFDGSGDQLTVSSNAAFAFAGDFTVEAWIYPTVLGENIARYIVDFRPTVNSNFAIGLFGDKLYIQTTTYLSGSGTVNINAWNHVAYVRNGTTVTFYLNGISSGSITTSYSQPSSPVTIGTAFNNTGAFTGYISNLRIVKDTAVYTSNFVPPSTAPLTPIAGTSLLTCQSNRFVDNSTNNFTVIRNGDIRVEKFNPFGLINASGAKTSYTPEVYGGSMYFDGSGDQLTVPSNAAFAFAGDFTVEAWIYPTVVTEGVNFIADFRSTTNSNFAMGLIFSGKLYIQTNTSLVSSAAVKVNINAWNHVAYVRNGTTVTVYLNGISGGSVTTSYSQPSSPVTIGTAFNTAQPFTGYISNLRIVKDTAVYTSAFTPPTEPLTDIANTVLLLNGTNAVIRDASMNNNLETVGDARVTTAVVKYGSSSMAFDGTGDYLEVAPRNGSFAFGTGNFTIEGWYYSLAYGGNYALVGKGPSDYDDELLILLNGTQYYVDWGYNEYMYGGSWSANTWNHFALVRNGANLTLYHNGVAAISVANISTTSFTDNHTLKLGMARGIWPFNGYMSDFRITKGLARYTTNFTPPTSAFKTK